MCLFFFDDFSHAMEWFSGPWGPSQVGMGSDGKREKKGEKESVKEKNKKHCL